MKPGAPQPPAWAEWVFIALLPAARAETESGDLLEIYRDEILPVRGRVAADWWYIRQVLGVFARSYGFWLAALVAVFVAADVANTYARAVHGSLGPVVLVGLVFAASCHGGWRTMRFEGGLFAGVATSVIVWLFMATWWMMTWYPFSLAQRVDPYWIGAWHSSAAPGETFTHWIFLDNIGATIISGFVLAASGVAVGLAGGFGGAAVARRLRRGEAI